MCTKVDVKLNQRRGNSCCRSEEAGWKYNVWSWCYKVWTGSVWWMFAGSEFQTDNAEIRKATLSWLVVTINRLASLNRYERDGRYVWTRHVKQSSVSQWQTQEAHLTILNFIWYSSGIRWRWWSVLQELVHCNAGGPVATRADAFIVVDWRSLRRCRIVMSSELA